MKNVLLEILIIVFAGFAPDMQALDYNDLEGIGFENCPRRNSCSRMGNIPPKDSLCECDAECSVFGDCCIDADRTSSRTFSRTCMSFGDDSSEAIYAINTCTSSFAGDEQIKRLCQNDDLHDLAKSAPVTDTSKQNIYLNHYCAQCNEVSLTSGTSWTISACKIQNRIVRNLSLEDIYYHPLEKKWGHDLDGQFQACRILFDKPPSVSTIGRSCRPNLISTCPGTWVGEEISKACGSYMSIVKDSRNNLYKSPHCAICNGAPFAEIMCLPNGSLLSFDVLVGRNKRNVRNRRGAAIRFTLMTTAFGFNSTQHFLDGCPEGQRYDPYFKKCRTIVCALPGYSVRTGRCVKD